MQTNFKSSLLIYFQCSRKKIVKLVMHSWCSASKTCKANVKIDNNKEQANNGSLDIECWTTYYYIISDLHSMGELTFAQGRNSNREHRRGFPQWPQTYAPLGGHFRRNPAKARPWQDEVPQNCQCQQGFGLHRQQRRQTCLYRCWR